MQRVCKMYASPVFIKLNFLRHLSLKSILYSLLMFIAVSTFSQLFHLRCEFNYSYVKNNVNIDLALEIKNFG